MRKSGFGICLGFQVDLFNVLTRYHDGSKIVMRSYPLFLLFFSELWVLGVEKGLEFEIEGVFKSVVKLAVEFGRDLGNGLMENEVGSEVDGNKLSLECATVLCDYFESLVDVLLFECVLRSVGNLLYCCG